MTRDDILDAAAQVFRQKGFHGAFTSVIAAPVKQIGITSLYLSVHDMATIARSTQARR